MQETSKYTVFNIREYLGEVLGLAIRQIQQLQYLAGGMVIFLEAVNEERLISFYRENGFQQFDTRLTESTNSEPHELIQLLRLF